MIRHLRKLGHELVYVTSKRGMEVLENNPHIEKVVQHDEQTPIDKLSDHIDSLQKKYNCEKVIDFSESIEVSLSQHPRSPNYKLSKPERLARFNRNFYEFSFEWMSKAMQETKDGITNISGKSFGAQPDCYKPELFFKDGEIESTKKYLKDGCFNVLVGMSGSGNNKAWPWTEEFCLKLCGEYPDIHLITVGDYKCKLIEPELKGRITNLSGEIPMRVSMALTGVVDLVIAPDTGLIHASGCYSTPKICLLGHNTVECITKHFENDYSVESSQKLAPCSPCLFLVYDINLQCPRHIETGASLCMGEGLSLERVYGQFKRVYAEFK